MQDTLVLIPARGGSTRIKDKNIKDFGGKPLISHIIEKSLKSNTGRVVVSTDSEKIKDVSLAAGAEVPFLRPKEFAGTYSSSLEPILHALQWFKENENWEPKYIITTLSTKAFTSIKSIQECKKQLLEADENINSCTTVCLPNTHPYSIISLDEKSKIQDGIVFINGKNNQNVVRSQDYPNVHELVCNCTITKSEFYKKLLIEAKNDISKITYQRILDSENCIASIVPQIESIDIDEPEDFVFAENLYYAINKNKIRYKSFLKINQKITLRQLKISDLDDVLEYSKEKKFTEHLGFVNSPNKKDSLDFIESINNDIENGNRQYWGIEVNKKIVGTIGYLNISKEEAELGFGISPKYWGKGIINQCMSFLIHYGFNNLNFKKLIVGTIHENIRTIEFSKKEGFIFDYKTETHTYLKLTKNIYEKEFYY